MTNYTIDQVLELAKELKIKSMDNSLIDDLESSIKEGWTTETFLYYTLNKEKIRKDKLLIKGLIRRARFPQIKYLDTIKRDELPGSMKIVLPQLETLNFIKEKRNVILTGNPGTGKTHISTGLGIMACKQGYKVLFITIHELLTKINESYSGHTLRAFENNFKRYDLVICDEFGYVKFSKENADLLFNLLSLRAEIKSTIITTNLAFEKWGSVFGDPILAGAMIDRLTHNAYLVNMNGDSYRTKETLKFNEKFNKK